jgi:hypothetical protein
MLVRILKYLLSLVLTAGVIFGIGKINAFGASQSGIVGFIVSLLFNQLTLITKFISWVYPGCWGSRDREECDNWISSKKAYLTLGQMIATYYLLSRVPLVGTYISGLVGSIKGFAILMGITSVIIMVVSSVTNANIPGNEKSHMTIVVASVMKLILGLTGIRQIEWLFGDY